MNSNNEGEQAALKKFAELQSAFEKAIIDRLAAIAASNGGTYLPSASTLKAAGFDALNEVIEAEAEAPSGMMVAAIWEATLHINESAFRQVLERKEKAGTLGFKVGASARAPQSIALQYLTKKA